MAEDVLRCKGKFHMHTSRISNFVIFFFFLTCTYRQKTKESREVQKQIKRGMEVQEQIKKLKKIT